MRSLRRHPSFDSESLLLPSATSYLLTSPLSMTDYFYHLHMLCRQSSIYLFLSPQRPWWLHTMFFVFYLSVLRSVTISPSIIVFFCFFVFIFIYLFIYFWLCWVFVSVRGLSLVAASGGHSSSRCAGLSLSRPLLLQSTGSRHAGSVVVAHGLSCSAACGILPDQGSNPRRLHWQADSQPLRHQGSPNYRFFEGRKTRGKKGGKKENLFIHLSFYM